MPTNIERTCFIPGVKDKEILGADSSRGWSPVGPECPPEMQARILEFRQNVLKGVEMRSASGHLMYPQPALSDVHGSAGQAWTEFTKKFPRPSAFRSFAGITTNDSQQRRRDLLNSILN